MHTYIYTFLTVIQSEIPLMSPIKHASTYCIKRTSELSQAVLTLNTRLISFKNTKILKVHDITKFSIANCLYKNQITVSLPSHQYPTQYKEQLCLPSHRLTLFQHSTMKLYLDLGSGIPFSWISIMLTLSKRFQNNLKHHLLDSY